ncbi:hypothetical protein EZJ19_05625 [Parasulfuritortus cantonensis]|uniref:Uncharacterized protein n=1 Tax=Parasulfuritortus cantonensis TaxID=2528202 RepID=A0A4R1BG92_9PROT|nr:hypothetical protein [Parasulfuritortus cantonensis]TCJ16193.1 hypothetical protein EZJ19_05625 [Parasulfuritortus cantonensis]
MLMEDIRVAADLIERTPNRSFHRVTGTASADILLAPMWCGTSGRCSTVSKTYEGTRQRQGSRVGRACTELKHVA